MSFFNIIQGDITRIEADCIVNAANNKLRRGGGVCGAIFKAAGSKELQAACDKIGSCPTGYAAITPAFGLKAKYIIHAVGPVWEGGTKNEALYLYNCYTASLALAKDHGCHMIAFPLISSGIFGYPKDGAWIQAIKACDEWIEENPDYNMDICFVVLDQKTLELGKEILESFMNQEKRFDQGNFVFFWKLGQRNEEFSNFYPCKFKIEGIEYKCVEQYMMAKKALLFSDTDIYKKVMAESDPESIKSYGRLVKNFSATDWDECKREVVYNGNRAKYEQNAKLLNMLLNTGNAMMAEASPHDKIWGIGMDRNDPLVRSPEHWKGENLLGGILEEIREEFKIKLQGSTLLSENRELDDSEVKMLSGIDKKLLLECIDSISKIEEINWSGGPTGEKDDQERDIMQTPFPEYPKNTFKALSILGNDNSYLESFQEVQQLDPEEMDLCQIRTLFTGMVRGERFCDGLIAGYIEDGTVLKCLKRIKSFLEEYEKALHDLLTYNKYMQ